jgi:hypothetical protein
MSSDWQTVKSRTSNKAGAYVPPHLRAAAAAAAAATPAKPKDLNLSNATCFPTLGSAKAATAVTVVTPTMNFKQTIKDLISYEQRSEMEKEREAELRRATVGFTSLKRNLNTADYLRINQNIKMAYEREKQIMMLIESGQMPYGGVTPASFATEDTPPEDAYVVLDSEPIGDFEPLPESDTEYEDVPVVRRVGARAR